MPEARQDGGETALRGLMGRATAGRFNSGHVQFFGGEEMTDEEICYYIGIFMAVLLTIGIVVLMY